MMEQIPCLICHRQISNNSEDASFSEQRLLTRFLKLFGRHTGKGDGNKDEILDHSLLTCCGQCSKIMMSFCDFYHQMKAVEVKLNWEVWKLHDIMVTAQREPAGVNEFAALAISQVGTGEDVAAKIINFRDRLAIKCEAKLKTSFPKINLRKLCPKTRVMSSQLEPVKAVAEDFSQNSNKPVSAEVDSHSDHNNGDEANIPDNIEPPTKLMKQMPTLNIEGTRSNAPKTYSRAKIRQPEVDISQQPMQIPFPNIPARDIPSQPLKTNDPVAGTSVVTEVKLTPNHQNLPVSKIISSKSKSKFKIRGQAVRRDVKHICLICGKKFKMLDLYQAHHETAHTFKCHICNSGFTTNPDLLNHLYTAHSIGERYHCQFCPASFAFPSRRDHHMSRDCPARKLQDDEMDWDSSSNSSIDTARSESCNPVNSTIKVDGQEETILPDDENDNSHAQLNETPKETLSQVERQTIPSPNRRVPVPSTRTKFGISEACEICSTRVLDFHSHFYHTHLDLDEEAKNDVDSVGKDMLIYVRDAPLSSDQDNDQSSSSAPTNATFKCLCGVSFKNRASYNVHYLMIHAGIRFRCNVCRKQFSEQANLQQHLRATGCGIPKPPVCDQCGKTFHTCSSLENHLRRSHKL